VKEGEKRRNEYAEAGPLPAEKNIRAMNSWLELTWEKQKFVQNCDVRSYI